MADDMTAAGFLSLSEGFYSKSEERDVALW